MPKTEHLSREEKRVYLINRLLSVSLPFVASLAYLGYRRYRRTGSKWSLLQPLAGYAGMRALSIVTGTIGNFYAARMRDDLLYPEQWKRIEAFITELNQEFCYRPLHLWQRRYLPEAGLVHAIKWGVDHVGVQLPRDLDLLERDALRALQEIRTMRNDQQPKQQSDRPTGSDDYTGRETRSSFPFEEHGMSPDTKVPGSIIVDFLKKKAAQLEMTLEDLGLNAEEIRSRTFTMSEADEFIENTMRTLGRNRGIEIPADDSEPIITGKAILSSLRRLNLIPAMLGMDEHTLSKMRIPMSQLENFLNSSMEQASAGTPPSSPSGRTNVHRYNDGDYQVIEFTVGPTSEDDDDIPDWLRDEPESNHCALYTGETNCCSCGKPPCDECGGCHQHCPHHRARLESIFGGMGQLVDIGSGMMAVDMYGQGEEGLRSEIFDLVGGPEGLRELRNATGPRPEPYDGGRSAILRAIFGDRREQAGICPLADNDSEECCPCGHFCETCGGCHAHCECDEDEEGIWPIDTFTSPDELNELNALDAPEDITSGTNPLTLQQAIELGWADETILAAGFSLDDLHEARERADVSRLLKYSPRWPENQG